MFLADNLTDSLLIYADWLEDNDQLTLATEIREELQEFEPYYYQYCPPEGVGGFGMHTSLYSDVGGIYLYNFAQVGMRLGYSSSVGRTGYIGHNLVGGG